MEDDQVNGSDLRVTLGRIEERFTERIVALRYHIDRQDSAHQRALEISAKEIERRLEHLNGEAARMSKLQDSLASRELTEQRFGQIEHAIRVLTAEVSEQRGKLWLPFIIIAGAGSAVAAVITRLLTVAH